ncbi:Leukocyte receptor cluster member 9 [Caligus rogercresseyi]|uniref:Leukocyte receptor cluster member 9 n=1 Tax=Caligus rogercresseyi TaxID=217165 RepID=A0A7T8K113_CALRO|nr:Leukocyte receptor cluster member 9 [Caligus rogercresseyi]
MEVFAIPRHRIQYFKYRGERYGTRPPDWTLFLAVRVLIRVEEEEFMLSWQRLMINVTRKYRKKRTSRPMKTQTLTQMMIPPSLFVIWATE